MQERYGRVAMALHWAIALLALFQIGLGWWMIDIPKSPPGLRAGWFNVHKSFGITIGLLMLARLGWRLGHAPPPLPASLPRWQARAAYVRNDARTRFDFNSYSQVALDLGFPVEFQLPFSNNKSWTLMPTFGWAVYHYDQPDPLVDPVVKRRDRELRAGVLLDVPLYDFAGIALQVLYSKIDSKLPNYDTHNLSVTFGPTIRF